MALRTRRRKKRNMRILAAGILVVVATVAVILLVNNANSAQDSPVSTATASAQPQVTATVGPTTAPTSTPEATASPSPTPTATHNTSITLQQGDENEDVFDMQVRLIELGYLNIDVATQSFGDKTQTAVKKFQLDNDLTDDGIAGPETLNTLYADDAKHADEY